LTPGNHPGQKTGLASPSPGEPNRRRRWQAEPRPARERFPQGPRLAQPQAVDPGSVNDAAAASTRDQHRRDCLRAATRRSAPTPAAGQAVWPAGATGHGAGEVHHGVGLALASPTPVSASKKRHWPGFPRQQHSRPPARTPRKLAPARWLTWASHQPAASSAGITATNTSATDRRLPELAAAASGTAVTACGRPGGLLTMGGADATGRGPHNI